MRLASFTAAVLIVSTLALGAAAPPASSDPSAPGATITFTPQAASGNGAVSPLATITCALTIDNPHESSHVPETVNVVAHWNCSAPMSALSMDVQLYYGALEVGTGHSANTLSRSLNGNAAANGCIVGTYYGYVQGTATAPPGYSPRTQTGSNSSQSFVGC